MGRALGKCREMGRSLPPRFSFWEQTSGSGAGSRCVLSYIAVRMMKMKTTTVADYLNVSQPTVSKSLLIGEEIINKNPGMVDRRKA